MRSSPARCTWAGSVGCRTRRRPGLPAILIGVGLAAVFVLGALVVRGIPALGDAVDGVLTYARQGVGPLVVFVAVVNGIAEELFFRGAMFAAVPARAAVLVSTAVYTWPRSPRATSCSASPPSCSARWSASSAVRPAACWRRCSRTSRGRR